MAIITADHALRAAISEQERLVEANPQVPEYREKLAELRGYNDTQQHSKPAP